MTAWLLKKISNKRKNKFWDYNMDKDTLDFFDKFIQIRFGDDLSQERLKKEYFAKKL